MLSKVNDFVSKLWSKAIFRERFQLISNYKIELFDENGKLKTARTGHNLVTVLCHQMVADQLLASPAVVKPTHMELGTGSGQDANDSTLATYISGSRTALDSKTRGANAIVTMVCTFPAGTGTGAVTEAGVFNVATQNTTDLLMYSSFDVINKAATDSMVITWTLTVA